MLQILLSRLSGRGVDMVIGSDDVTCHFSESRAANGNIPVSNLSRYVGAFISLKKKRKKRGRPGEKKGRHLYELQGLKKKTVNCSSLLQRIANVVKLELIGYPIFIERAGCRITNVP